jgi:hypothetical protein
VSASDDPRLGHRCARCGAEIPDDAEPDEWRYVPEAGTPERPGEEYPPTEHRGQLLCAACDS